MGCYSRLMVKHPFVLIVVDIALAFVLGPLTVWIFGLPDFSDPTKGFDPRGTKIHNWERVGWNIRQYKNVTKYPTKTPFTEFETTDDVSAHVTRKKRFVASSDEELQRCVFSSYSKLNVHTPRLLVASKIGTKNIFTVEHLHSICRLADMVADYDWPAQNCFPISLPLIITALAQKKSCNDVTDSDMREVTTLVQRCAVYYFSGALTPYCEQQNKCPSVPVECLYFNGVYAILHLLTDIAYMKDGQTNLTDIEFSLIIIPSEWYKLDKEIITKFYLDTFEDKDVFDGDIVVKAMSFNIEREVFNTYVLGDIPWYALAMSLVVIILLVYLQSMILMIAVVTNVTITLCLSYFIYYYICQIHFFPFLNLIAALLLIAIGADDVFIMYDLWRQELRQNPTASYEEIMTETLRKGGLSIFVTSLTTAAALLSNLASSITTIRCFGIFAGICMVVNFILMITWIPALIIITEKVFNRCIKPNTFKSVTAFHNKLSNASKYFWGVIVMKIITKASAFWVVVHLAMGILGFIVVFLKPGLKLPEDNSVAIFSPDHPFEMYNRVYKERIRFEQEIQFSRTMMLQIVWGADESESGNVFDPDNQSDLNFAPLDIYSPEAMSWLNELCDQLREQPFISGKLLGHDCYHRVFEKLVTGPCDLTPSDQHWKNSLDIRPCCELSVPVNDTMMKECMSHLSFLTNGDLRRITGNQVLGEILFDWDDNIRIFRYVFPSNRAVSLRYQYIDQLVKELEAFVPKLLQTAPTTLENGGYCSLRGEELIFYNVQTAIARGTITGIAIALGTGFLVLMVTSLNVILALYAIVTIGLIIACTLGTLVMLGWELGVTESLTITLSVGLAVDFTIHYAVAYKLSRRTSRSDRVKDVVQSVSSAVTMAALTTFISGIAVLPGRVLAYHQFGVFFVFIMLFSWLFSTFFFLSVCYGIGPVGNTGDILYLLRCCSNKRRKSTSAASHNSTGGLPIPAHLASGVSGTSTVGTSPHSIQKGIHITGIHQSRAAARTSHGSVDGKLRSTSETVNNLTPRSLSSINRSITDSHSAMRDPDRNRGSRSYQGPRRFSEKGRERRKHHPEYPRSNAHSDGTTYSGSTEEHSKTYTYNRHVYCVGDVHDDKGKNKRPKKDTRQSFPY